VRWNIGERGARTGVKEKTSGVCWWFLRHDGTVEKMGDTGASDIEDDVDGVSIRKNRNL